MNTLPTASQRADAVEESFLALMNIVRDLVDDKTRDKVIELWAGANYNSRFIGWEEGYSANH